MRIICGTQPLLWAECLSADTQLVRQKKIPSQPTCAGAQSVYFFFFCSQLTGLAAPPYLRPPPLPSARCSETNKSKAARGWGICACQSGERKRRGRSSREGRRGGREGESEGFQRASGEAELTRSQRAMGGRLGQRRQPMAGGEQPPPSGQGHAEGACGST